MFLTGVQRNSLTLNDQGVTALYHDHVFVVVVSMFRGWCCFAADPKRHLASVRSVKYITFNARGGLIGSRYPVRGMLHELRKIVDGLQRL